MCFGELRPGVSLAFGDTALPASVQLSQKAAKRTAAQPATKEPAKVQVDFNELLACYGKMTEKAIIIPKEIHSGEF